MEKMNWVSSVKPNTYAQLVRRRTRRKRLELLSDICGVTGIVALVVGILLGVFGAPLLVGGISVLIGAFGMFGFLMLGFIAESEE